MSAGKKIKKGISLFEEKKYQQALSLFKEALQLDKNSAEAWHYYGLCSRSLGNGQQAFDGYNNALRIEPQRHETQYALAQLFLVVDNIGMALRHLMNAAMQKPDDQKYVLHFLSVLADMRFNSASPEVLEAVSALMVQPFVEGDLVARTWSSLYRYSGNYRLLNAFGQGESNIPLGFLYEPQLINALAYTTIQDIALEDALRSARKRFLLNSELWQHIPFLAALALQGFNNEYVWSVTEEETQAITAIKEKKGQNITLAEILLLGSYEALSKHPNIAFFAETLKNNDFGQAVWKRQIDEPSVERSIADGLKSFTSIENDISAKVREQYEENPYPRWDTLNVFPKMTLKEYLTNYFPSSLHHHLQSIPKAPKTLIAGVGTGRQVLSGATVMKEIDYTAIDLSKTSLAYGIRKQRELFPDTRITWGQADILKLGEAFPAESFDIIESCGVLHHMHDPLAGWEVLTKLLRKKGLMKIALYSAHARKHISFTRQHIADNSIATDSNGIRHVRELVKSGNFLEKLKTEDLLNSKDFYSLSGCRDLLFHAQEHQFTLPQIKEAIQKLGLRFVGMELHAHEGNAPLKAFLKETSRAPTLEQWNEYELEHPTTFGRMYQFWLQKE